MRDGACIRRPKPGRRTFASVSGLWPTPAASVPNLGERPETWLARAERLKAKHNNGNGAGMPLSIAVQMWPTPRSTDGSHGGRVTPKKGRNGGNLVEAVAKATFPTGKGRKPNNHTAQLPEVAGGTLNPEWVEWLMAWPIGWSGLKPLATDRYRRWCATHGKD